MTRATLRAERRLPAGHSLETHYVNTHIDVLQDEYRLRRRCGAAFRWLLGLAV
jgi:hypothetical protein